MPTKISLDGWLFHGDESDEPYWVCWLCKSPTKKHDDLLQPMLGLYIMNPEELAPIVWYQLEKIVPRKKGQGGSRIYTSECPSLIPRGSIILGAINVVPKNSKKKRVQCTNGKFEVIHKCITIPYTTKMAVQ